LDYIVGMLEWDANVNPRFGASNRYMPKPVKPFEETEPEGYRERWVTYGTAWYSAKEVTVLPKRTVTITDRAAYGIILTQGTGLVGKGGPGDQPPIELDTMLDLTAKAEADGTRCDGVDLFLFDPHVSIDSTNDDLQRLADKIRAKNLMVGSLVAPVWPPTGGGSAMGSEEERKAFLTQVRKACAIGRQLEDLGVRRYGIIRIDSATSPAEWAKDPAANTKQIAETVNEAADN